MSWQLTLDELVKAVDGQILSRHEQGFTGVGTDTRVDLTGQIFIPLKGENFDAHQFLDKAVLQGARALIFHELPENFVHLTDKVTCVQVEDSLVALQDLAHYWRQKHAFKVLGISGSNGKTTTKEFAKILIGTYRSCYASQGSFNNHWGVPLSLLKADSSIEFVVQEMGMSAKGELTRLCQIAEPDVVMVTMVGSSHVGRLGSQQAIAEAKEEMYLASPQAQFVFNMDNEYTIAMHERALKYKPKNEIIGFSSFRSDVDVSLRVVHMDMRGLQIQGQIFGVEGECQVPILGRHNVTNLMAASALAHWAGLTAEQIWQALPRCQGAWGRNQLVALQNGTQVLFDAYNANPESMAALIKNLYEMTIDGKKIVVLGEMLELGDQSPGAHRELGELVGKAGVDVVWFMGEHNLDFEAGLKQANFTKSYYLSDTYEQKLASQISSVLNPEDIAVVKGSRGMKLERVLQAWGADLFLK